MSYEAVRRPESRYEEQVDRDTRAVVTYWRRNHDIGGGITRPPVAICGSESHYGECG
jgi:hypothetical protein